MRWRWARVLGATAFVAAARLPAQQVPEVGVQVIGTGSDPELLVGGGYAALRMSRRFRLSGAMGVGGSGGQTAWRGELLAHFLLAPGRREGVGGYLAGGEPGAGT